MPKLAIWPTVVAAYRFVFTQPLRLLRISGFGLLLIILIDRGPILVAFGWSARLAAPASMMSSTPAILFLLIMLAAINVLCVVWLVSFVVAWHRAVLLGEDRSWIASLRLRRREWRLVGYSLLLMLLIGTPTFVVTGIAAEVFVAALKTNKEALLPLLPWLVAVPVTIGAVAWMFLSRLMLVFPAVAADAAAPIEESWARSHGNWLRLYFGPAICVVPLMALQWLFMLAPYAWLSLLVDALTLLEIPVLIAFYSFAYERLAANALPAAAPAPQAAE